MNIMGLFTSLMCEDHIDIDIKSIIDYAYGLKKTSQSRSRTNRGGWQSDLLDEHKELQPLILEINKRLNALREIINFNDNIDLKIESLWININSPYSYNARHIHPGSYMSGCFYIKVPEKSGNIVFKHPAFNLMFMNNSDDIFSSYNEVNSLSYSVLPQEKKLLLFPGWIEHEVEQNLSNEDRISIAFNTCFYKSEQ